MVLFLILSNSISDCDVYRAKWVRMGDFNALSDVDERNSWSRTVTLRIARTYVHKMYREDSFFHDIALLKLEKYVDFTEFVRPSCLYTEEILPYSDAIATGWGWGYVGLRKDHISDVIRLIC